MTVKDQANALAQELANSEEYREYVEAKKKLAQDETNMALLNEYKKKQMEFQMAQAFDQEVDEDEVDQLETIFQLLSKDTRVNEFLTAEYKFQRLLGDIHKILSDPLDSWYKSATNDRLLN